MQSKPALWSLNATPSTRAHSFFYPSWNTQSAFNKWDHWITNCLSFWKIHLDCFIPTLNLSPKVGNSDEHGIQIHDYLLCLRLSLADGLQTGMDNEYGMVQAKKRKLLATPSYLLPMGYGDAFSFSWDCKPHSSLIAARSSGEMTGWVSTFFPTSLIFFLMRSEVSPAPQPL